MGLEPIENVIHVVSEQVVADEMAGSCRIAAIDEVEELDESLAVASFRQKAEKLSLADIICVHQAKGAVANVLRLAPNRLPWAHPDVGVFAFERLDPGFLVHADDVLAGRGFVAEPQHVITLGAKVLVMRGEPQFYRCG